MWSSAAVRRMRDGAAPDHFRHLARVHVELFVPSYCIALQDALSEVTRITLC